MALNRCFFVLEALLPMEKIKTNEPDSGFLGITRVEECNVNMKDNISFSNHYSDKSFFEITEKADFI